MQDIISNAKACCEHTIEELGYELVDVEYVREEGQMCLNYYIYKQNGISIDDCEAVSRAIDPLVEEADPTNGKPYCLCVSSPGERPFKTQRDYERNLDKDVEVTLNKPLSGKKKKYKGKLVSYTENEVVLKTENEETAIPKDNIDSIKPYIGF